MGNSPKAIVRDLLRGGRALSAQWNRWGLMIILTCLLVAGGSIVFYVFGIRNDAAIGDLARGLIAGAEEPAYADAFASLGSMLCSAAMTIWLLGAFLVRGRTSSPIPLQFFVTTALFSFVLMLDDAFAIHEVLFPGSPQTGMQVLFAVNALFMLVYLLAFARQILDTEYVFLLTALCCFAASTTISAFAPYSQGALFFGECFKFAGVIFWVAYPAVTIPYFVHRVQLLEWSRDTLRVMVGDGGWERKNGADLGNWGKIKRDLAKVGQRELVKVGERA